MDPPENRLRRMPQDGRSLSGSTDGAIIPALYQPDPRRRRVSGPQATAAGGKFNAGWMATEANNPDEENLKINIGFILTRLLYPRYPVRMSQ